MSATLRESPIRELILEALDDSTWLLVDRARKQHDPHRIVACIEELPDGRCETVWVSIPGEGQCFAGLSEVLLAAVERLRNHSEAS